MHKRPEDGMWLPTGGKIENGHIRIPSSAQGDRKRKKETVVEKVALVHTILTSKQKAKVTKLTVLEGLPSHTGKHIQTNTQLHRQP